MGIPYASDQQAATPLDSLIVVLGSSSGGTLRRIARDLDSTGALSKPAAPRRQTRPAPQPPPALRCHLLRAPTSAPR